MKFFKENSAVLAVMLIALILRIWGINFGLPYQFHQDEPIIVNHALAYGTGDLNPHFFIIPPLTSYILFGFYVLYFLTVNLCGICRGAEAFSLSFFSDPTPFYIIGRTVLGVLPSVLSVYFTYRLALKFFSKKSALYAALVMAVTFLNIINAHYAYTDNLLVLFVILAYISMTGLIGRRSAIDYILAGVAVGLAVATKYNAILLAAPFLVAHVMNNGRGNRGNPVNMNLLVFIGTVIFIFIAANPYSILDGRFFSESLTHRIRGGYQGPGHHVAYSLFEGMGVVSVFAGVLGLAWFLRKDLKKGAFLISFPVIFYMHLVFKSQPFPRYVLPLIPFMAIGMAFLFSRLYEKAGTKVMRLAIIAASLALVMPTIAKSIKADTLFAGRDTRIEAKAWIEKNIPAGTSIALAHTFFSPPIQQAIAQLKEKEQLIAKQPELKNLKSRKLKLIIKTHKPSAAYQVYYLKGDNESPGQFFSLWPMIGNTLSELEKNDIRYVIFSNMDNTSAVETLREKVSNGYEQVAVFSPYKDDRFRFSYDMTELTCIPVGSAELFSRRTAGPYLVIYKIR